MFLGIKSYIGKPVYFSFKFRCFCQENAFMSSRAEDVGWTYERSDESSPPMTNIFIYLIPYASLIILVLSFCYLHLLTIRNQVLDMWKNVMFSDESRVFLQYLDHRVNLRRRCGECSTHIPGSTHHKCMFLMNVAPFKGEIIRLSNDLLPRNNNNNNDLFIYISFLIQEPLKAFLPHKQLLSNCHARLS